MPIIAERVCVRLGADGSGGPAIFQDLSCTLQDDAVTVVAGKSGSGKSTLLDVLAGLREPQAGTVRYGDSPLWVRHRLNPDVNRRIGAVFQQPEQQLFAASVRREFRYSLRHLSLAKPDEERRIRAAMETMQLPEELLERSPFLLSVGQQRRVALAAALAAGPAWLFLDEPTAALDPEGVAALTAWLRRLREQYRCGIVIATHDLDALLPLADRVIVLDNGAIAADLTPQELYGQPDILLQAGVGWPSFLELSVLLREAGMPVAADSSAEAMAASIERLLRGEAVSSRAPGQPDRPHAPGSLLAPRLLPAAARPEAAAAERSPDVPFGLGGQPAARAWVTELDPRAKWAFLVVVSVAMLLQNRWTGVACSFAAALALVACCRYPLRRFLKMLRAYFVFTAVSVGLSGLQPGGGFPFGSWFSAPHALATARPLLRLAPVMMLGLLFGWTTSHFKLKRGLEQSLSWLKRGRAQVEALTFTVSMMFRFIPLLEQLVERFSRIVRARGKSKAKPGSLALRDVHAVLVPFLLSCFQLAEHLSLAAESKGYRVGNPRTSSVRLRFRLAGRDGLALAAGAALAAALWLVR
jgi:energy-coupling factor transporter ATP-binding protein EcfA2/energy-coupling factor transporter transmembrane protein EcfT